MVLIMGSILSLASVSLSAFLSFFLIPNLITRKLWHNLVILVFGALLFFCLNLAVSTLQWVDKIGISGVIRSSSSSFIPYIYLIPSSALGYFFGILILKFRERGGYVAGMESKRRPLFKILLILYVILGFSLWVVALFSSTKGHVERQQHKSPPPKSLGSGPLLYIGNIAGYLSVDSNVLIYDLNTKKHLRTISLGGGTSTYILASKDEKYIFAINSSTGNFKENKLRVIDTSTHSIIKTIEIGKILGSYPRKPILASNFIFIPSGEQKVVVFDLNNFEVTKTIVLGEPFAYADRDLTASSNAQYLFYSYPFRFPSADNVYRLAKIGVETNQVVKERKTNSRYLKLGISSISGEDLLYALGQERLETGPPYFQKYLYSLESITLEEKQKIPLEGFSAEGPILDPKGESLFVLTKSGSHPYTHSLYVIDLVSFNILEKHTLSPEYSEIFNLGVGKEVIYIPTGEDRLTLLDKASMNKAGEFSLPKYSSPTQFIEIGN